MVNLYSTGCPKCKVLEKKLTNAGIEFKIHDNVDEVAAFCDSLGLTSVPVLEVNGKYLNFGDAIKWVGEQK